MLDLIFTIFIGHTQKCVLNLYCYQSITPFMEYTQHTFTYSSIFFFISCFLLILIFLTFASPHAYRSLSFYLFLLSFHLSFSWTLFHSKMWNNIYHCLGNIHDVLDSIFTIVIGHSQKSVLESILLWAYRSLLLWSILNIHSHILLFHFPFYLDLSSFCIPTCISITFFLPFSSFFSSLFYFNFNLLQNVE